MQSKRINRNFTYSKELKIKATELYLSGESVKNICKQLKIHDENRIYVWLKAFNEKGETAFVDQRGKHSTGRPKTNFMSLEEEVEYLRAQNLLFLSYIIKSDS